jgi:hypothetical protein
MLLWTTVRGPRRKSQARQVSQREGEREGRTWTQRQAYVCILVHMDAQPHAQLHVHSIHVHIGISAHVHVRA